MSITSASAEFEIKQADRKKCGLPVCLLIGQISTHTTVLLACSRIKAFIAGIAILVNGNGMCSCEGDAGAKWYLRVDVSIACPSGIHSTKCDAVVG